MRFETRALGARTAVGRMRSRGLAIAMALSVAAVALLALWDETREANAELHDLAGAQATLASVTGAALSTQLSTAARDARAAVDEADHGRTLATSIVHAYATLRIRRSNEPATTAPPDGEHLTSVTVPVSGDRVVDLQLPLRRLVPGTGWLDRTAVVLVSAPYQRRLRSADGEPVEAPGLIAALAESRTWYELSRAEAATLGLPPRLAVAGLAIVRAGDLGDWGVVVATSASRERDRQSRARWRLVLGVLLVGALVLAFGGVALRTQRKELELERVLSRVDFQRERDEQLAREGRAAMMVTLAAGVAHEISTPLNVIAGRAEQLEERAIDDRSRHGAHVIAEQASRIGDVVRGFLRLARGDAPALENVSPGAVSRAAIALVTHRFEKAGVSIEQSETTALPAIRGDARLLEQALINLLLNACDACERGGKVEVRVERSENNVRFAVLDDGSGISPADAARVVEPFFTTKPMDKGTGLGLAITNEIVAIHRGTLHLESRLPRGTIAAFSIPIESDGVCSRAAEKRDVDATTLNTLLRDEKPAASRF